MCVYKYVYIYIYRERERETVPRCLSSPRGPARGPRPAREAATERKRSATGARVVVLAAPHHARSAASCPALPCPVLS